MTADYIGAIGRFAYIWAWPMMNLHNRITILRNLPEPGLMGGVVPIAPPNQLSMLTDYIQPEERLVACPNQDVVYGFSILTLDEEPVVVQVPDFGDRFWVYQVVDQRTDSFGSLGKMYGTRPGLYMIVGPDWKGQAPADVQGVLRSNTNVGVVIPRVFLNDTAEDRTAVQEIVSRISLYPLSRFDGTRKSKDWKTIPHFPTTSTGEEETKWVDPKQFFDALPKVLNEVPALPGEEALYASIRAMLVATGTNQKLQESLTQVAIAAEKELMGALFEFRNYGIPLAGNWTTQSNGAQFGTDYFTRAAVAESNIFVNKPSETKYFYQDLDGAGARLNGNNQYTVTFAKSLLPPVKGFWSLTLYNKFHFFQPNELKRYSLGTKNKTLQYGPDGSLTLYVSAAPPAKDRVSNWLPAPKGDFSLYVRCYWPEAAITYGKWTPPPVQRQQ
jgi:hypothetical protein